MDSGGTGGRDEDEEDEVDEVAELGVAADEAARFASAAATHARMSTWSIASASRNGCSSSCAYVGRCSGTRRKHAATKSSAAGE